MYTSISPHQRYGWGSSRSIQSSCAPVVKHYSKGCWIQMHLTIIHTQCLQCLPSKTVAVWEATCCGWKMLEVWWTRYSLRMLEGRLRKDCPTAKDTDVQEAHLLRTSCIPVLLRGFQWFQVPRLWHRRITEACRSVMIIVNFYVEDCGGAHSPQHNRLWICFRTFKAIYIAIRVVTWVSLMHLCKYI